MVTTFDPGRMIWHGYTGAAGWMFRQGIEGVLGYRLVEGQVVPPSDPDATPLGRGPLGEAHVKKHVPGRRRQPSRILEVAPAASLSKPLELTRIHVGWVERKRVPTEPDHDRRSNRHGKAAERPRQGERASNQGYLPLSYRMAHVQAPFDPEGLPMDIAFDPSYESTRIMRLAPGHLAFSRASLRLASGQAPVGAHRGSRPSRRAHVHARELARQRDCGTPRPPSNKMVDPVSGYPFEGWNQDPKPGAVLSPVVHPAHRDRRVDGAARRRRRRVRRHARTSRESRR